MAIRILIRTSVWLIMLLSSVAVANDDRFIIGPGDTIAIEVYNESDLSVRAKISQSGILRIPLIGDINVLGKTAQQLSKELELALLDGYLVSPSVSVIIESFRPFYIRGAVRTSGVYDFESDLTVDQAIAMAGGLKDRASKRDWFIIRGKDKNRIQVNADTSVMPGDIIEIEESLF